MRLEKGEALDSRLEFAYSTQLRSSAAVAPPGAAAVLAGTLVAPVALVAGVLPGIPDRARGVSAWLSLACACRVLSWSGGEAQEARTPDALDCMKRLDE